MAIRMDSPEPFSTTTEDPTATPLWQPPYHPRPISPKFLTIFATTSTILILFALIVYFIYTIIQHQRRIIQIRQGCRQSEASRHGRQANRFAPPTPPPKYSEIYQVSPNVAIVPTLTSTSSAPPPPYDSPLMRYNNRILVP